MANKDFLEKYPLYKKYYFEPRQRWNVIEIEKLSTPSINMHCRVCGYLQTYNVNEDTKYTQPRGFVENNIFRLQYFCTGCKNDIIEFAIRFQHSLIKGKKGEEDTYNLYMEKIGQFPAWSIDMDKELEKILGEHSDYYKKGLVCESQSYGIGAYAYFRRITENVIGQLLESILDLVDTDQKEIYKKRLEDVKDEKSTEKKIDLISDLLPKSLIVDGVNPLKTLHSVLSQGIHNETDEECMKKAEIIRNVLVFLVNQITRSRNDKKSFVESLKKLLTK